MARTKKTAVIDTNSVNITEFCTSQGLNEQIFRLELMQFVEDADSTKTVNFEVATTVANTIQATTKALPQNLENSENLTTPELQPSQDAATEQPLKPQNSPIVANTPKEVATTPKGQNNPVSSALEELIASAEDDINLADLVLVYRNQQIEENTKTRDQELVANLRERRLECRNQVFDSLRNLNGKQPTTPDLPELPSSLSDEITALSNELGKKLNHAA